MYLMAIYTDIWEPANLGGLFGPSVRSRVVRMTNFRKWQTLLHRSFCIAERTFSEPYNLSSLLRRSSSQASGNSSEVGKKLCQPFTHLIRSATASPSLVRVRASKRSTALYRRQRRQRQRRRCRAPAPRPRKTLSMLRSA